MEEKALQKLNIKMNVFFKRIIIYFEYKNIKGIKR
jgi:hypothetical protein